MPEDLRKAFDPLIRLMKNWEEGILNYFRARHTNAHTESNNARIKKLGRNAPRLKMENFNAKIIHGTRLKKQHEAVRDRAKGQRRGARHTEQPVPSSPVDDDGAVPEPPQESEVPMLPTTDSILTTTKQQGPRLDVDRIRRLNRSAEGKGETASPSSPQMSLFE